METYTFKIYSNSKQPIYDISQNTTSLQDLRYGKTSKKNLAKCFATSLQTELNNDVARFTTDRKTLQPHLLQDAFQREW